MLVVAGARANVQAQGFDPYTGFDPGSQPELSISIQQVDLPDLFQVQPNRVFAQFQRDSGIFKDLSRVFRFNLIPFRSSQ